MTTNKTESVKCIREFIRYALLNIIGMLGISCYILADTFFVSKALGTKGLAALNIALPVFSFMLGTGLMLGMGGGIKYSISKVNDSKTANKYFTHSIWMGVGFSIIYLLVGIFLPNKLAVLLGADEDIRELTAMYINTVMMFAPAFVFNNLMQCFVRNDGNPKLSMIAMVVGSLANVVLDYVFMFPLKMGMFGAAFATGIAPIIGILIQSTHIIRGKNGFKFVKTKIKIKRLFEIIALGFPSLVTELSTGIVIIIFNLIIMDLSGNTGVAAYGIIANISMVVVSMFTGIAQGSQPLISKAYGEENKKHINIFFKSAILAALITAVLIYLIVFFGAETIASVFNSEKDGVLQSIAVYGMKIYFAAIPFAGINIIYSAYFAAVGRAIPAHIISLMRGLFLIIPVAFLLPVFLKMTGVWLAFPVTEIITCLVGSIIYIVYANKKINNKK